MLFFIAMPFKTTENLIIGSNSCTVIYFIYKFNRCEQFKKKGYIANVAIISKNKKKLMLNLIGFFGNSFMYITSSADYFLVKKYFAEGCLVT